MRRSHLLWLLGLLAVLFASACSNIRTPRRLEFTAAESKLIEGDSTLLAWSILDDDLKGYILKVDGVEVPVKGAKMISPSFPGKTYRLRVFSQDSTVGERQVSVVVTPKPIAPPVVLNVPAEEEINDSLSKYAVGLVNYKPEAGSGLHASVFGVDLKEFPKKVRVLVSVRDDNGNLVTNLAPPYNNQHPEFWKSVTEEHAGKSVAIDTFTVTEVRRVDARPKSVALVGDYSGSMEKSITVLDEALGIAMRALRSNDDYSLIQFDHTVSIVRSGVQGGIETERIPFEMLMGATAFYTASIDGLETISSSKKENVAVLFTDGHDNASYYNTANDVVKAAFSQGARTFIIGFDGADTGVLSAIARNTNGRFYLPQDASELTAIYEEIFRTLDVHYVIEYEGKQLDTVHNVKIAIQPAPGVVHEATAQYLEQPEPILEDRVYVAGMFKAGSAKLANPKEWRGRLDDIVKLCQQYPDRIVVIRAHTDTWGSESQNLRLSTSRAQTIANELQRRGVNKNRLKIVGSGESQPIHERDTEKWQSQENRRAEVFFIK